MLTGLVPFHRLRSPIVAFAILRGERPKKPQKASFLGFTDTLWGLLQSCWSEKGSERPSARQLFDYLRPASLAWAPSLTLGTTTGGGVVSIPAPNMFTASGVSLSSSVCQVQ